MTEAAKDFLADTHNSDPASVFFENTHALKVGDLIPCNCSNKPALHWAMILSGSDSVFIKGRPAARVGDKLSCGGTVPKGCSSVRIGGGTITFNEFSQEAQDNPKILAREIAQGVIKYQFEKVRTDLEERDDLSPADRVILRLPEIFEHIADFVAESSNDKQGWRYLADMVRRWVAGPFMADAIFTDPPFYVPFDWLNSYDLVKTAYDDLNGTTNTAANEAGMKRLLKLLKDTGKLPQTPGETVDFDFITHDPSLRYQGKAFASELEQWNTLYCNSRAVPRVPQGMTFDQFINKSVDFPTASPLYAMMYYLGPSIQELIHRYDGLMVAMGAHTLKALPAGSVTMQKDGSYKIHVSKLAFFAIDSFNFQGNQSYWYIDPETQDYDLTPIIPGPSEFMGDEAFNEFSETTGKGRAFYVISDPGEAVLDTDLYSGDLRND